MNPEQVLQRLRGWKKRVHEYCIEPRWGSWFGHRVTRGGARFAQLTPGFVIKPRWGLRFAPLKFGDITRWGARFVQLTPGSDVEPRWGLRFAPAKFGDITRWGSRFVQLTPGTVIKPRLSLRFAQRTWRVGVVLMLGVLGSVGGLQADGGVSEYARLDSERWYGFSQSTLMELNEMAGDFDGYASVAWELQENLQPSIEAVQSQAEADLSSLEPQVVTVADAFFRGTVGSKVLFLMEQSKTLQGRRGYARSDKIFEQRLSDARRAKLDALNDVMFETRIGMDIAAALLKLPEAVAAQVSGVRGEDAEWAESPGEIHSWIEGQLAADLDLDFRYFLNRLDDGELDYFLEFAQSGAGIAFFEGRYHAALHGAHLVVETMLPLQASRLQEALWEYKREEDQEDDEEDPEDGS